MGEVVHFASDQLVFRPPEQSLSRAIHGDNETLPIHRIESFADVAKDRLLVLQGLTEPFTALSQDVLLLNPLRDVPGDLRSSDHSGLVRRTREKQ